MHYLFSYGTLQLESVQRQTYGRLLKGASDRLHGYTLDQIRITDPDVLAKSQQEFHPIARFTGNEDDFVQGIVFEISDEELEATDAYEVSDYERKGVQFASGKDGWIYVERLK